MPTPRQTESAVLSFLGLLFAAILLEGLAVAGSGFLPDEGDTFVTARPAVACLPDNSRELVAYAQGLRACTQERVLPAFTPTLGAFLVGSSLYGLWKTGGFQSKKGGSPP